MKRSRRRRIVPLGKALAVGGLLAIVPNADADTIITSLSIEQISFDSEATGEIPNSELAHVVIDYVPDPVESLLFLNVLIDIDGRGPGWVIQNQPLDGAAIVGPTSQSVSATIDLTDAGVSSGEVVAGLPFSYGFAVTPDPLESPPVVSLTRSGQLGAVTHTLGGVSPLPEPTATLPPRLTPPLETALQVGGQNKRVIRENIHLYNKDVGLMQCVPAALTISFRWLVKDNQQDINLGGESWYATLEKVKRSIPNYQDRDPARGIIGGVPEPERWIRGKMRFLQQPAEPDNPNKQITPGWQVEYQGVGALRPPRDWPDWQRNGFFSRLPAEIREGEMTARKDADIATFAWILKQLEAGEDVEAGVQFWSVRAPDVRICGAGYVLFPDGRCYRLDPRFVQQVVPGPQGCPNFYTFNSLDGRCYRLVLPVQIVLPTLVCAFGYTRVGDLCYLPTSSHMVAVSGARTAGNQSWLYITDDNHQEAPKPGDGRPARLGGLRNNHRCRVMVGGPREGPLNGYTLIYGVGNGIGQITCAVSESPPKPGGELCCVNGNCVPNVLPETCVMEGGTVPAMSGGMVMVVAVLLIAGIAFKFGRRPLETRN